MRSALFQTEGPFLFVFAMFCPGFFGVSGRGFNRRLILLRGYFSLPPLLPSETIERNLKTVLILLKQWFIRRHFLQNKREKRTYTVTISSRPVSIKKLKTQLVQ